jgi:branched-chain amino acid aminotransferase
MEPLCEKIWVNGKFVPWNDATIHLSAHVIHYGSCVFEGIRCYDAEGGPAIFRLREHAQRLLNSAKIYRMAVKYTLDELVDAMIAAVRENKFRECYIRPIIFRGVGAVGVNPGKAAIDVAILTWYWGAYLGAEGLEKGVDVQVSTWTRPAPNTLPAIAKSAANYMPGQMIKMEAIGNGFVEGIGLDVNGLVSEGSGENLFFVTGGRILTPPLGSSILGGITRDTVISLAKEFGYEVVETTIPRELLYVSDEVFMVGTAAEVTPLKTVDRIAVGNGQGRGPVTKKIQEAYLDLVKGKREDKHGWLTRVYAKGTEPAPKAKA